MRTCLLLATTVALAGCSFIDDWGSLTTRPIESMDGGDRVDGGGDGPDGAPDAMASCDRCGAGCPVGERCEYDPEMECRVCVAGNAEGSPCTMASDCAAGQTCFAGVCARECTDGASCTDARLGATCIESGAGQVCFGVTCDVVDPESCDPLLVCQMVGFDPEENAATACVTDDGTRVREGETCEVGGCEGGTICIDTRSEGTPICERLCWADGDCDDGRACAPIGGSAGNAIRVNDRELGVCFAGRSGQGETCVENWDCYGAALCSGGQCRMPCASDADCDTGTLCVDLDGDGSLECR